MTARGGVGGRGRCVSVRDARNNSSGERKNAKNISGNVKNQVKNAIFAG